MDLIEVSSDETLVVAAQMRKDHKVTRVLIRVILALTILFFVLCVAIAVALIVHELKKPRDASSHEESPRASYSDDQVPSKTILPPSDTTSPSSLTDPGEGLPVAAPHTADAVNLHSPS
eukprot:TRINITY_DN85017_c0_g1_i1.p1 TRINITY_DN85017_c0_g1~~TRINITY_DN85017_c0_g1_i1.p1  ORF type:complete len:119 (-),score=9.35 TRINITY_DN85017_c0_g1_i1:206-562(-)